MFVIVVSDMSARMGIVSLAPRERPQMDSRQIDALCHQVGEPAAEDILCRALEDVGIRLMQIEHMAAPGTPGTAPHEDLHKALRGLAAVASQIGLSSLAQVARDVMQCVEDADPVAQAATLARLLRTGEASFAALCREHDLSI